MKSSDRGAGVPPAIFEVSRPRLREVKIHDQGWLPHWEMENGAYFITFRLADSLPKSALEKIIAERADLLRTARSLNREVSPDQRAKLQRLSFKISESYLDRGAGQCHLKQPAIAKEMANALRHFDGQRYHLFAWCVMPNHVHVVVRIFPGWSLASLVHSWKSFAAKRANQALDSQGTFWQREYYDHLIRNEGELERSIRYVARNPEKARLAGWPWVWTCGRDAHTTFSVAR